MKTCENCKYWKRWFESSKNGRCSNLIIESFIDGSEIEGFEPKENFGCILWMGIENDSCKN